MAPSPLEDEHAPLFTVGQVADMLAVKQAFLRRVDELRVVSPQRSAGGQRRYTRYEVRVIQQVVSMADEGITLQAIRRIIDLEQQLAEVTRQRDELARLLAERPLPGPEDYRDPEDPGATSASCSRTGSAAASADRCSGVRSSRLAVSIRVFSARMRSSASRPCVVMVMVLARASLGSAHRRT
jgi:MerR family transcriptional regulator, heat shock protein HspR